MKKVLTKGERGGILTKLSGAEPVSEVKIKKFFEKLKKVLDKDFLMCYLNKVAAPTEADRLSKNFEKSA